MKASWIYSPKDETFELKGCWARLFASCGQGTGTDRIVQILVLRQLCHITAWLSIIGVCSFFSTCKLLTS